MFLEGRNAALPSPSQKGVFFALLALWRRLVNEASGGFRGKFCSPLGYAVYPNLKSLAPSGTGKIWWQVCTHFGPLAEPARSSLRQTKGIALRFSGTVCAQVHNIML